LYKHWIDGRERKLVTAQLLGKAAISRLPYEQRDGEPLRIAIDHFGKQRDKKSPSPGPFESFKTGLNLIKVF
jgi:hypothetical protein